MVERRGAEIVDALLLDIPSVKIFEHIGLWYHRIIEHVGRMSPVADDVDADLHNVADTLVQYVLHEPPERGADRGQ